MTYWVCVPSRRNELVIFMAKVKILLNTGKMNFYNILAFYKLKSHQTFEALQKSF